MLNLYLFRIRVYSRMGKNIPNKCPVMQLRVQNGNLFLDLDKNKKVSKARYPQGVALWGLAAKADESVLARNQTKDSWT